MRLWRTAAAEPMRPRLPFGVSRYGGQGGIISPCEVSKGAGPLARLEGEKKSPEGRKAFRAGLFRLLQCNALREHVFSGIDNVQPRFIIRDIIGM